MKKFNRFIDTYQKKYTPEELDYSCGTVAEKQDRYIVAGYQYGAELHFSVGQPVYDTEDNLLGYLGVGLFRYLNYSSESKACIPVERWEICLPTKFCTPGKKIVSYFQKEVKNDRRTYNP